MTFRKCAEHRIIQSLECRSDSLAANQARPRPLEWFGCSYVPLPAAGCHPAPQKPRTPFGSSRIEAGAVRDAPASSACALHTSAPLWATRPPCLHGWTAHRKGVVCVKVAIPLRSLLPAQPLQRSALIRSRGGPPLLRELFNSILIGHYFSRSEQPFESTNSLEDCLHCHKQSIL